MAAETMAMTSAFHYKRGIQHAYQALTGIMLPIIVVVESKGQRELLSTVHNNTDKSVRADVDSLRRDLSRKRNR